MTKRHFGFTIYRSGGASSVGITFQPTPKLSLEEVKLLIAELQTMQQQMEQRP